MILDPKVQDNVFTFSILELVDLANERLIWCAVSIRKRRRNPSTRRALLLTFRVCRLVKGIKIPWIHIRLKKTVVRFAFRFEYESRYSCTGHRLNFKVCTPWDCIELRAQQFRTRISRSSVARNERNPYVGDARLLKPFKTLELQKPIVNNGSGIWAV